MEDYIGKKCDNFNMLIKSSITELKKYGRCYVYKEEHVKKIQERMPDIKIIKNECGFTLKKVRREER